MPRFATGSACIKTVLALALTILLAAAPPVPAFAETSHYFDINTTDASAAVRQLGRQAGVQILAPAEVLRGKKLNPVTGEHTTEDALQILLTNSGLTHRYVGGSGVVLIPIDTAPAPTSRVDQIANQTAGEAAKTPGDRADGQGQVFWDQFRVAQTDHAASEAAKDGNDAAKSEVNSSDRSTLQEVVVTAEKREERQQDVPIITVIPEAIPPLLFNHARLD